MADWVDWEKMYGREEKPQEVAMAMVKPMAKELMKPKPAEKKDVILNPYVKRAFNALVSTPIINKGYETAKKTKEQIKSEVSDFMYRISFPERLIDETIGKELNKAHYTR